MQRDLLDALRCPLPHEEQWLVALVHDAVGAVIRSADLACPRCDALFPVRDGIADFRLVSDQPAGEPEDPDAVSPDADRLAALLGVTSTLVPCLLAGSETRAGAALAALGVVPQLWINPAPEASPLAADQRWASLRVGERLPLGRGTLSAAALDGAHARHPAFVEAVALAIRPGGRLVAPADTPVPLEVTILARDARQWVGEVTAAPGGLVMLRRQSPPA